jgi:hypothetical protein
VTQEPHKTTGQVAGGQHMKRLPDHVVEKIRRAAIEAAALQKHKSIQERRR